MDFLAVRKAILAKPKKIYWRIFLYGTGITALLIGLTILKPDFFRFLEFKIYDTYLRSMSSTALNGQSGHSAVIVDIDDQTLARFGQWPWPRYRVALLLEKIKSSGASTIAIDMFFPEPDRTSLTVVQKEMEKEFGLNIALEQTPPALMDNDQILADVLSTGPFILANNFTFSDTIPPLQCDFPPPPNTAVWGDPGSTDETPDLFNAKGIICSIEKLTHAAAGTGFINVTPDFDGVLRRAPLLISYQDRFYPSLALKSILHNKGIGQVILQTSKGKLESINFGDVRIPVDTKANLLIRYGSKTGSAPFISAQDILLDLVPHEKIHGKIVLVGSSAAGLEAYHTTPNATTLPGVSIHTAIMNNILNQQFFSRPHWAGGLEVVWVLALGLLSAFLLSWARSVLALCFLIAAAIGSWLVSGWILQEQGRFISPLFPLLSLGLNFSFLTFLKYKKEDAELRKRNKELVDMQNFTIQCLAALTETRDTETGGHILRCQHYVKILSTCLAATPRFATALTEETIDLLFRSSPLHDIGKIGIPDRILLKPDRLTDEEFEIMKLHTTYGRDTIQRAEKMYGKAINGTFLEFGKEMAYTHHEKWDGTGYPEGLSGETIPIFGRIMALADVYDALICKRRYKPAFTHEEAVEIISRNNGTYFDPAIVEAFIKVKDKFRNIALKFPDQ